MRVLQLLKLAIFAALSLRANGKILRNSALINRMVSKFHNEAPEDPPHHNQASDETKPKVLGLMQNVLCKNFPSIPCEMITQDKTLKKLIERSILQISSKKIPVEKTTQIPGLQLTLFPIINSEELSNFLAESQTGYFTVKDRGRKKQDRTATPKTVELTELKHSRDGMKDKAKRTVYTGRKNIRKFYPHKVKYKDKNTHILSNTRKDFGDYSEDKLSMSVEVPDMTSVKKHTHYSYKREPENPPVWRIDYTKHGEPSLNMFAYENDQLRGKLIKGGPNVIVDENVLSHVARKDVLHPDVYIKKTINRKNALELNSEALD